MKHAFTVLAAAALLVPAGARAQTPAQCDPDLTTPQLVARSWFAFSQAISALNANTDPTAALRNVLRTLTDPRARDREQNRAAQDYITARAYVLLMAAGTPAVVRRGDIGIQTEPDATIDLFVAADSLLTASEAAYPGCAGEIAEWRQQKPWLDVINAAVTALNADQFDSAEALARRAMILDRRAPYAYSVLANVAQARQQDSAAIDLFRQAVRAAGTDTTFADVRARALGEIAQMLASRVTAAPPPRRAALAREAIAAYEAFLAERELEDIQRGLAISEVARLYTAAGDSARLRNVYAAIVANPSAFGERTLLEAGVVAIRAGAPRDAATLFAAAYALNPHSRDAINNLAAAYVGTGEHERVFPLAARLIAIDPNNPEAYLLPVYAYSEMLKTARTAAQRAALTDSLTRYHTLSERVTARVTFNEFARLRAQTRLRGAIENRTRASKTYSLEVELLKPDGTVAETQTVSVGPVAAGQSATFTVNFTTPGAQVAGFRYKPLT